MAHRFVAGSDAVISYLRDGEVIRAITIPPGVYALATFSKGLRPGEELDVGGVTWLLDRGNTVRATFGDLAHQSAANPSFRMSPGVREARRLQAMMTRTQAMFAATQRGLTAIKRARSDVQRIAAPEAPASEAEISAT